jgi:hypothetical protein
MKRNILKKRQAREENMKTNNNKIIFWALCDLSFIALYVVQSTIKGRFPIISDIGSGFKSAEGFGVQNIKYIVVLGSLLFVSILVSGLLLLMKNKIGAILVYIQTPIRIISVTPSLYFIFWPLKYIPQMSGVVIAIILFVITEGIKLINTISWHKTIINAG